MKNTNYYLKNTFFTIFIATIFSGMTLGQNVKRNLPGKISEVKIEKSAALNQGQKADKSEYIIHDQGDMLVLYNKKNSLMIYESSYERKLDFLPYDYVVKFHDWAKIDSLVFAIIAPFYRDFKPKYSDDTSSFNITLYSKTDGRVCELLFAFNQNANIPFKSIEKLENEILALGIKLEFDPNSYFTKDALWINYPLSISVGRMKEKLKVENK